MLVAETPKSGVSAVFNLFIINFTFVSALIVVVKKILTYLKSKTSHISYLAG
jgi:hypothetical protein